MRNMSLFICVVSLISGSAFGSSVSVVGEVHDVHVTFNVHRIVEAQQLGLRNAKQKSRDDRDEKCRALGGKLTRLSQFFLMEEKGVKASCSEKFGQGNVFESCQATTTADCEVPDQEAPRVQSAK